LAVIMVLVMVGEDSFKANFNGNCCLTFIKPLEVFLRVINLEVEA